MAQKNHDEGAAIDMMTKRIKSSCIFVTVLTIVLLFEAAYFERQTLTGTILRMVIDQQGLVIRWRFCPTHMR